MTPFYIKIRLIHHFIHIETLLHLSALKGTSAGSIDRVHEPGQQNTCPNVDIRLYSSILYVTQQLSDSSLTTATYRLKWIRVARNTSI